MNNTPEEVFKSLEPLFRAKAELDALLTPEAPVNSAEAASIIHHAFVFAGSPLAGDELIALLGEYAAKGAIID